MARDGRVMLELLELVRRRDVRRFELGASLGIAAISTAVLLGFRATNPGQGAEHYYSRENRALLHVMQACYVVVMAAIVFNVRHVLSEVIGAVRRGLR